MVQYDILDLSDIVMMYLLRCFILMFVVLTPLRAEELYFSGQSEVTPQQLIKALEELAIKLSSHPTNISEYQQFLKEQGFSDRDLPYLDYVKVRMIFEATRDGGLWHLRWRITDLPPNASVIWQQWSVYQGDFSITADAECDELSALFAQLLYHMKVRNIGLFWPTYNHTVAVWTVQEQRIVVPTSQVFLDSQQTLGTTEFDPSIQKTIYEYRALDVEEGLYIPVGLARYMIQQIEENITKSNAELQGMRHQQVQKVGGS